MSPECTWNHATNEFHTVPADSNCPRCSSNRMWACAQCDFLYCEECGVDTEVFYK